MKNTYVRYRRVSKPGSIPLLILGSVLWLAMMMVIPHHAFAAHSASCSDSIAPPSGYCVTSDFHGTPVPIGTSVNVMAFTTDTTVDRVRFIWHAPDGSIPFDEIDLSFTTAASGARRFDSIHVVTITGDWGVQAIFCSGSLCDANNKKSNDTEAVRATSYVGVPEFDAALPLMISAALATIVLAKRISLLRIAGYSKTKILNQDYPIRTFRHKRDVSHAML